MVHEETNQNPGLLRPGMKLIIGITGSFGVGKSTVCRILEKLGAKWIESDAIVHELYKPGKSGYLKIAGYFGKEFVDPKKGVKRDKLRNVVLQNPQKLWILQKLIHPLVIHEASKKFVRLSQPVCLEAIYFEKEDLGKLVDKLIEVRRKPELVRKARVKEGKWNLEDIERFMRLSPIFPKPNFVIENNGTLEELEEKIRPIAPEVFVNHNLKV